MRQASAKSVLYADRDRRLRELGSGAPERVNYRPLQITGRTAEWFAAPG
jgi:hypothetical protein